MGNDHYNQVNWAEYYRFSEMFYAYGRYDDHPSAGEYRDYSYDDRGYHEEPYEGKKRKEGGKRAGRESWPSGGGGGDGREVSRNDRVSNTNGINADNYDDEGSDDGDDSLLPVKSCHELDADEMAAELKAMGYCWSEEPTEVEGPDSKTQEKSHHSGGTPSCVSGVEMLETKAPLKILSGVLSDVQADRRRFRKRRRIERKEEEEEEEKVESEEEAGELEMGNSDVDRKTDEPREFPETKTVGKTVESSKNEENRMEEKERSGDESGGGGRRNDGIEPRVMDD